jgi:hypothetical protein
MKEEILSLTLQLQDFLTNAKVIATHPYSKGIDAAKMLTDVLLHIDAMVEAINRLPDDNVEETIDQ